MSLKYHAKELKGISDMAIFNLLCKVYCQVRQSYSINTTVHIGEVLT